MGNLNFPLKTRDLSLSEKEQLVEKLLACQPMRERSSRNRVVQQLLFANLISRNQDTTEQEDAMDIVNRCLDFSDGLQQLAQRIAFREKTPQGYSQPIQDLCRFLEKLFPISMQQRPNGVDPLATSAGPLRLFADGLCAGRPLHPAPDRYFVSHGFTPEKLMDWRESITETLAHANQSAQPLQPYFSGDKLLSGFRLCGICERIYSTTFSLFLLPATQDRNVYLELGMAIGLGKPFFLIRDRNAQIPPVLTSLALYTHGGSFRTMRRELAEQIEEYDFAAVQFTQETTKLQILPQYLVVAGESFDDEDFEGSIDDAIQKAYPQQQLTAFPLSQHLKQMPDFDLRQIVELIQTARFAIYRVDEQCSATTFLALGMSIGLNRPFIMINHKGSEIPLNLRGLGIYQFANYVELERDVVKWHRSVLDRYVQ